MDRIKQLINLFPVRYQMLLRGLKNENYHFTEIRLRVGQPVILEELREDYYVREDGELVKKKEEGVMVDVGMLRSILDYLCQHSLYAYQDQFKNGFFTIAGGHRVGVAGTVIAGENGKINGLKYISYMNIRIASECRGVSRELLPWVYFGGVFQNTLLISSPGQGKTTMLRDLICELSEGNSYGDAMDVSVVDERGELSGTNGGYPIFNLGEKTDVMYGCNKASGMLMLLRSMSPKVIAVDELGGIEEREAIQEMTACGVKILATIHGSSLEDIKRKQGMETLLKGVFRRLLILERKNGSFLVEQIYKFDDEKGEYITCNVF